MYIVVLILHILVSIFLIGVILLQAGRGGLTETFGGGITQAMFGARAANVLTRLTAICAILFISTCLTLTVLSFRRGRSLIERVQLPRAPSATTPAPAPAEPTTPAAEPAQPAAKP